MKPTRNPESAAGDWYIDTACIDCGASRHVAPNFIVERHGKSVFARQPTTPEERLAAWRAVLVCPTASVRSETKQVRPQAPIFPQELSDGVWRCGFNARSSFGAHSYFVARPSGNLLVDSPRSLHGAREVVRRRRRCRAYPSLAPGRCCRRGQVRRAVRRARVDPSRRPVGRAVRDRSTRRRVAPARSRRASSRFRCPGTRAAASCTCSTIVCSSPATRSLGACASKTSSPFAMRAGIHGARSPLRSRKLADYRFEWLLPGHGWPCTLAAEEMNARLRALVTRMREG